MINVFLCGIFAQVSVEKRFYISIRLHLLKLKNNKRKPKTLRTTYIQHELLFFFVFFCPCLFVMHNLAANEEYSNLLCSSEQSISDASVRVDGKLLQVVQKNKNRTGLVMSSCTPLINAPGQRNNENNVETVGTRLYR